MNSFNYILVTCTRSTSTGVSCPNKSINTVSFSFSLSSLSILPDIPLNGPSMIDTLSPTSTSVLIGLAVASPSPINFLTSSGDSGIGLAPLPLDPINPVTPGVLRTTYHASSHPEASATHCCGTPG